MAKKLIARKGAGMSSEVYAVDSLSDAPQYGHDWEEVALGDGGGSSFAHLTEDAGSSSLIADWPVTSSGIGASFYASNDIDNESAYGSIGYTGVQLQVPDGAGWLVQAGRYNDSFYGFRVDYDGHIILANGTGTCTLSVDNSGNLLINGAVATHA